MERSLEIKSLKDLVRAKTNENSVLLIDVSSSMNAHMRNGKTRIQGLREVVTGLQAKKPTTMIAFGLNPNRASYDSTGLEHDASWLEGKDVDFVDTVPDAYGGTPLAKAIDMAGENGFGRVVVISDGEPNPYPSPMDAARRFGGRIDVIFVGDPGDPGSKFLDELAKTTGGQRFEGDLSDVKEITGAVIGLLGGEVLEQADEDEDDDDEDEEDDEDDEDEDDEEDDA